MATYLHISGKLVWAVLAAVLPATALSAYNGLSAFERVTTLSRDAARNLRRVQPPRIAHSDAQGEVSDYVMDVVRILEKERGQWGQLAVEPQATREGGRTGATP
jgi:hypothetical protein